MTVAAPPDEREAEHALLGCFLLEPARLGPYVDTLAPELFHKDRSRIIWEALCRLHRAGHGIDAITVAAELRRAGQFEAAGGQTMLGILQEEGTVATLVPEYVEILQDVATRRMVRALAERLGHGASNGQSTEALLAEIRAFEPLGRRAASGARVYIESLAEFLAEADPPQRVIFPELLPAGVILLLHGEPRSRKSLAAFELALSAATGSAPFGLERFRPAEPIRVLYVQEEDPRTLTKERLQRLVAQRCGADLPDTLNLSVRRGVDLDDPGWVRQLVDDLARLGVRLLVLDAARRFSTKTDEGPAKVREFTAVLRHLVTTTGVTIVIVHHDVKPPVTGQDVRRRSQRASGADWFAVSECPVHVERVDERESLVYPQDYKFAADPAPFTFRCQLDGRLVAALTGRDLTPERAETAGARGKLLAWLQGNGPASKTAMKKAGFGWESIEGLLEELMRERKVDAMPGRTASSLVYFVTPEPSSLTQDGSVSGRSHAA